MSDRGKVLPTTIVERCENQEGLGFDPPYLHHVMYSVYMYWFGKVFVV